MSPWRSHLKQISLHARHVEAMRVVRVHNVEGDVRQTQLVLAKGQPEPQRKIRKAKAILETHVIDFFRKHKQTNKQTNKQATSKKSWKSFYWSHRTPTRDFRTLAAFAWVSRLEVKWTRLSQKMGRQPNPSGVQSRALFLNRNPGLIKPFLLIGVTHTIVKEGSHKEGRDTPY